MNKFLYKIADRVIAVAGAFVFCQIPSFMREYVSVLSGHLEESKSFIKMIEYNAALTNKTLPEYIQKFLSQTDNDFMHQGQMMQSVVDRYEELYRAYIGLQDATVWEKPFVFVAKIDMPLAEETYASFTPALTLNAETVVYAFTGILVSIVLFRVITKIFKVIFLRKKPKG